MHKDQSRWMPIGKAAEYLGVSKDTLRRWEKKGKIKSLRSPTNRRYYTKNQLDMAMLPENSRVTLKKASRSKKRLIIPWWLQLATIGVLSLTITVVIFLLLQSFLLKPLGFNLKPDKFYRRLCHISFLTPQRPQTFPAV